ncbi:MAG: Druantia anti-phage system protein DruA [Gammaproteobacteria bacterium]
MIDWAKLTSEPITGRPAAAFVRATLVLLARIATVAVERDGASEVEEVIALAQSRAQKFKDQDERSWAESFASVVGDLVQQGWMLEFRNQHLYGLRPLATVPREILRQRLLVRRDEQLMKPSVREFVERMEHWRLYRGTRTSILSLMRDGRALTRALAEGTPLDALVDPYVQFVTSEGVCELTGLRTQDIWRYFRHTWSSPYESSPGRSLQFLVRDRAVSFHPVIGIAALGSAAVRLGPRDRFIGWDTDQVVERLQASEPAVVLSWARKVVQNAVQEIYIVDLVRDKLLPADPNSWTRETAAACADAGLAARAQHHRLMEAKEYKSDDDVSTEEACVARAELYLFRAKRASELAKLIPLLLELKDGLPEGSGGRDLLARTVRVARSKTVGTEVADLTVCGAIAPYAHLAGGKLVAMLAVTPEVVAEYRRRYRGIPGIIASSMAGRPIVRPANLCYIGTTSLYGRRPNQYDRLGMTAQFIGGEPTEAIRYEFIKDHSVSRTQGIGTFHFSSRTLKKLERFVQGRKGGWKANNVFGEGTSPKLRGLRDGLIALGLSADELLVHGIERCMYGVKLVKNLDRYLLGMDPEPDWIFDPSCKAIPEVSNWWIQRWGRARAERDDVRERMDREVLAHPIRHNGKVHLPGIDDRQSMMF